LRSLSVMLPRTADRFDVVYAVMDRLTMKAHFVPTMTKCAATQLAKLCLKEVARHHGLPA